MQLAPKFCKNEYILSFSIVVAGNCIRVTHFTCFQFLGARCQKEPVFSVLFSQSKKIKQNLFDPFKHLLSKGGSTLDCVQAEKDWNHQKRFTKHLCQLAYQSTSSGNNGKKRDAFSKKTDSKKKNVCGFFRFWKLMLLFVRKRFLTIQSNHLVLVKWISFYILFKYLLENTVPGLLQIFTNNNGQVGYDKQACHAVMLIHGREQFFHWTIAVNWFTWEVPLKSRSILMAKYEKVSCKARA